MKINLDKSSWKRVRLGDVIGKIEENDRENAHKRFDRFLKVEHMDTGSLHIKRWSSQKNNDEINPTFYKIFRAGQILYPTRNPHLKRAVLADFDGICGEKTLTLHPNSELIDSRFAPFIFHSDLFYDHTVGAIIGSTNPHIRWRDVANYTFLLPPKTEQARLAELLWAMDEVIEREKALLHIINSCIEIYSSNLIWKSAHKKEKLVLFGSKELGKFVDGDWIESKDQSSGGIRLLQLGDIGVREFINKTSRFISEETFKKLRCFEVLPEDVIIARMPEPIGRSCIVPFTNEKMITAVDCCVARVNPSENSNRFLMYLLNSKEFLYAANALASGTTRQRIGRKALEEIEVPKPSFKIQQEIVSRLDIFINSQDSLKLRIASSQTLFKSLTNEIF